ncbi:MAG: GtrA family protein [Promethearchaeota archaeon]|nr:MAG: GtrA family protein [Candidatus Lokiarchaeota archaeon]
MENKGIEIKRQMLLYFIFAAIMIFLNYGIQKLNEIFAPIICSSLTGIEWLHLLYCTEVPNMSKFLGSVIAVGITYIIKFFLDKFIVFKAIDRKLKQTSKEFIKYFIFAILTTLENIGIQFILDNIFGFPLELSVIIALSIGYLTKFFLDRKYVFENKSLSEDGL